MSAGADEHASLSLNVDVVTHVPGGDSEHTPRARALADDVRHRVPQQDFHAGLARALLEASDESGPVPAAMGRHHLARDVPFHGLVGSAGVRRGPTSSFLTPGELDAVGQQELERGRVLVRELADDVAVAVTGFRVIVPGPVRENHVGRVHRAVLLLQTMAAAKLDGPPAQHAAAPDIEILLDHDHGGADIAGRARASEPRNPSTDDDHVRRPAPLDAGSLGLLRVQSSRRHGHTGCASGETGLEKTSPADGIRAIPIAAHGPLLQTSSKAGMVTVEASSCA